MTTQSNSTIYDIWKFSMKLEGTQLSLRGHSRGSEKSCFYIPELKIFLDAGVESYLTPKYIFITHCHSDHSLQLPQIVTGRKEYPNIYAPIESRNLFQTFLQSSYQLRKGTFHAKGKYCITGASPGMEIDINKEGYFVRVYNLHHNVPTRGYGICQTRTKLNPLYHGMSGKELKELKDNLYDISIYNTYKIVAYVLDTTIECFDTNPELLEYKYVIVECTFFMDESDDVTNRHIHWRNLKQVVNKNPDVKFILVHFSMRYTWEDIISFFEEQKKDVPNIIVWTN
jgi:ribonuclease Z